LSVLLNKISIQALTGGQGRDRVQRRLETHLANITPCNLQPRQAWGYISCIIPAPAGPIPSIYLLGCSLQGLITSDHFICQFAAMVLDNVLKYVLLCSSLRTNI